MACAFKYTILRTVGILSAAAGLSLAGWAPTALAQVPQTPPAVEVDSFRGKDPVEGVYVRDSTTAVDKLANAQRMERLKEWGKAADYYQEVIAKYPDRVVPSQVDKDNRIYQYTSITYRVQEKLAHWPQEGLDVYRARYDTAAQALLDKAGPDDAATLNKVYSQYFITTAGKQAGIRLIDLYMESGEFPAAAWLGDRLLRLHPGLLAERAAVLYRTALAYYYAGDAAKARERLDELKSRFPNDRGTVRGKDVILAQSLAQETQAPLSSNTSLASADSYRMIGGNESHNLVSDAQGRPGARLYGVILPKPSWPNIPANQRIALKQQYNDAVAAGLTLGVIPVCDRGELYFQDGRRIYAVVLESGVPLPGWTQTWPDGVYTMPAAGPVAQRKGQLTCTLTDHEVLAVMGKGADVQSMMMGVPASPQNNVLVCLDRDSGRQKWTVNPGQLPDEAKEERGVHFTGSPLVVGDSVLVIGRSMKQAQFEDCYVLAFDLASGKFRWATYVASASAAPMMFGMGGMPIPQSDDTSHLAYANGRVFVQTNLGAFAALDAYGGAVVWLDIYPTDRQSLDRQPMNPFMRQSQMQAPPAMPWSFNPVIVDGGYAFTLPTDSHDLLVYDTATGVEIKRIDMQDVEQKANRNDSHKVTNIDTLLGVIGDRLVLTGERGVVCLNWRNYSREKFDPDHDNITAWINDYPKPIRGRGFLMKNSVYIPCADRLYCIDLRNGKTVSAYPNHPDIGDGGVWEEPEGPGNVIATSDHVIIAGASMLNVYTDLAVAKAKLDRELAAAPTDAQPRLRYAEVLFVAGEPSGAMKKLDEAATLLGGIAALQPGLDRDRLFNDALTFAGKLAKNASPESRQQIDLLFDRAAAAALSPMQQVHYRLSRAKYDESNTDNAGAVKLYQQILADPLLRPVPLADEAAAAPAQAQAIAQKQIAIIIGTNPSAYEPFQQAAAAALATAQAATQDTADKLLEVARAYPNSAIAGKAMLAAADRYETQKQPRQAIRVLRDMWFKYPDAPDKGHVAEALARNYLMLAAQPRAGAGDGGATDNIDAANARLALAVSLGGAPVLERDLTLPDGKVIAKGTAIAQALEITRKFRGEALARALPDFHIPLPAKYMPGKPRAKPFAAGEQVIANVRTLVVPLRDFARNDRIIAYSTGGSLDIYAAGQTKPLASSHALAEEPKGCAWIEDNLLVWDGSQLASLKPDGQTAWTIDLAKLPTVEVMHFGDIAQALPDNTNPAMMNRAFARRGMMLRNGQRVIFRRGGRVVINAAMVPGAQPRPAPGAAEQIVEVRPVGDRVLLTTTTGRLLSLELAGGAIAWQTRLADRPVDRLAANEDFAVVKVSDDTSVRIAAFDTATGQMRCTHDWLVQTGLVPVNLALAADGTLVYTMPNSLCLKDLYKPWGDPSDKEVQANPGQQPPFGGATQPDQLLISEGRILALADNGTTKYVRVHSLETGQPLLLHYKSPSGGQEIEQRLEAGKSWNVKLRAVGPRLFVLSPGHLYSFNLDHPADSWATEPNMLPLLDVREMFFSNQYLAVVEAITPEGMVDASMLPNAPPGGPPPVPGVRPPVFVVPPLVPVPATQPARGVGPVPGVGGAAPAAQGHADGVAAEYRVYLFRLLLSPTTHAQSGKLDYNDKITNPAGITPGWLGADGGLYYQSVDNKLHFLRGAEAVGNADKH